jgi:deoxycytidine triphosphate deaminase
VAPEFKVFTNVHNVVVDPKNFDARSFVDVNAKECIVTPLEPTWWGSLSSFSARGMRSLKWPMTTGRENT